MNQFKRIKFVLLTVDKHWMKHGESGAGAGAGAGTESDHTDACIPNL